ncbi:MAG TPA: hypothetical protein VMU50_15760 [Polyangia bacterium]|nr:hypothetical protein [Polyangia bacterium]
MEAIVLSGVVVHRSRDELMLTGRLRMGLAAACVAIVVVVVLGVPPSVAIYVRIVMGGGVAIGAFIALGSARTRLVLRPTGFIVSGYESLRRYRLTGPLAALDVVGVVPMMPQFENMPYKDPDYFLQLVVDGRIVRAFRGLPRGDLDEIAAQIRDWRASCAG